MPGDYDRLVAPGLDEELHSGKPSSTAMGTNPIDGLPSPVAPANFDKSPPLSEDTLVCMGDLRAFVVRSLITGEVVRTFSPAEIERLPNGSYRTTPVKREGYTEFSWVEPIRPPCVHYLRMQTDVSADRDRRIMIRACMAQKTEEGEFYSIRDTMVTACTLRSPRHIESEQILDNFDRRLMEEARERKEMEEFDVDKELAGESDSEELLRLASQGGLGVLSDK